METTKPGTAKRPGPSARVAVEQVAVPGELRIVPPGRQAESEVLPPRDRHRPVSRRRVPPASVLRPRRDTPHSRERRIPDEALSPRRTPAGAAGHRRPRRRRRRRLRPGRLPATDIRRAGSGPQAHQGQLHHHPQVRRGRQGAHEQRGHQRPSPLHVFNGFSAKLSADQLADLRRDPSVKAIEEDQKITAAATQNNPTWGLDRIDQRNRPLSGTYTYNRNRSGVSAYIIDTGIDTGHTDYGGRARNAFPNLRTAHRAWGPDTATSLVTPPPRPALGAGSGGWRPAPPDGPRVVRGGDYLMLPSHPGNQ